LDVQDLHNFSRTTGAHTHRQPPATQPQPTTHQIPVSGFRVNNNAATTSLESGRPPTTSDNDDNFLRRSLIQHLTPPAAAHPQRPLALLGDITLNPSKSPSPRKDSSMTIFTS
jgi:hypothetical protein